MKNKILSRRYFEICALLFVVSLLLILSPACAENQIKGNIAGQEVSLVPNGSFDEGEPSAAGWTVEGGAYRDAKTVRTGRYSACIARSSAEISSRWVSNLIPCTEKMYSVSGWIATDMDALADFSFAANLVIEFVRTDGGIISREVVGWSNGRTGWQYRIKKVEPPPQSSAMRLVFEFSKNIGKAWLDDVCITVATSEPVAAIEKTGRITKGVVSLEVTTTALAGNIFRPDEPVIIRAALRNATNEAKQVKFEYWLTDFEGHVLLKGERPVIVPAKGEGKIESQLDGKLIPAQEYLELQARVVDDNTEYDNSTVGLGILPKRKPTTLSEESYFGLLGDGLLAQDIGARWTRPSVSLGSRQPASDKRYGIETIALITSDSTAGIGPEGVMNGSLPLDKFVDYVRKIVGEYKGIIKYYQIGNECEGGKGYVAVLKAAYEAAKGVDPDCKIVCAGISYLSIKSTTRSDLLKAGLGKYCDAYDYHIYEDLPVMDEILNKVNQENERYNAVKPQFITEFAAYPVVGISEPVKAAYVIKRYILAISQKIDVSFWHVLRWPAGVLGLDQVGLMNPKGDPWVSFFTFAAMTRELEGAKFSKRLDWGNGVYAFQFDHKTHTDLVLWSDKGEQALNFKTNDGPVNITEINGRTTSGHTLHGQFTVTAGYYPYIIALPGPPELSKGTALLKFTSEEYVVPAGGKTEVKLVAYNPTGQPISGQVVLSGPGAIRVLKETQAVSLAPGESHEIAFMVAATETNKTAGFLKAMFVCDSAPAGFVVVKMRLSEPIAVKSVVVSSAGLPKIKVSIQNLTPLPVEGTVSLVTELTKQIRPEQFKNEFPPIAPGKTYEAVFQLSAPADMQSMYNTEVTIRCQNGLTVSKHELLSFAPGYYADKTPVIDGDLSEWEGKMPLEIPYRGRWEWIGAGGKPPVSPEDLSARIGVQWDKDHFYLAVEVKDDIFRNENSDLMMWKGDSLQFTIDPDPEGDGSMGYYEFTFAKTPKGNQFYASNVPVGKKTGFWQPEMAVVRKNGKTCYEIALDKSQVDPLKLQEGIFLGFALIVNEQDAGPRSFYGWYSGIGDVKTRGLFGRLTMVK